MALTQGRMSVTRRGVLSMKMGPPWHEKRFRMPTMPSFAMPSRIHLNHFLAPIAAASTLLLAHAAFGQTAITLDGTSGGMTTSNNYSTTGGLDISLGFFVDYLVVGGGGGNGSGVANNAYPSGGGGGGVNNGSAFQIQTQPYSLTVGAGGTAGGNGNGGNGGASTLFGVTAVGGSAPTTANPGVGGTSASGHVGGNRATTSPGGEPGGGGGGDQGAGGTGGVNSSNVRFGGTGGIGTHSDITGSSLMYGFGGGGGAPSGNFQNGDGTSNQNARANSGGGGAGAGAGGGPGAAGTVTVRYAGAVAATGGTITSGTGTSAGYTLQTFTTAGSSALNFSGLNLDQRLGTTAAGLISGSGDLSFHGPGRLTLTGANTYSGATTVAAGRLYVDGNQSAATGTGTVNSGALLGGSGIIGGSTTVQSGGTVAPGDNTPGKLSFGGDLTLASGSTLSLQVGGTVAGTSYSQGLIAGQLTLSGTLSVSEVNGFTLAIGQKFYILDNSSANAVSGVFSNAANSGTLYSDGHGDTFFVNYMDSAGDGTDGNDVTLTVLTVPEPRTWGLLLVGTGLVGLGLRRRIMLPA